MPLGTERSCHYCKLYSEYWKLSSSICMAGASWDEGYADWVYTAKVAYQMQILQVVYKAKKKGCQAHPGLAAVVEDPQQGLVSWITAVKASCSCLRKFFLIESWHCSVLWPPSLLVSCDNHLLFCLGSKAILALPAFPSVYLDSSSAFRAHKFPSPVLFARFWYTTLLLKTWVSWCLTSCLFLSHFLALCCMWYVSELFIFILNPRYTHTLFECLLCVSYWWFHSGQNNSLSYVYKS